MGRKVRGNHDWKKQIEDHAVAIEPVAKADVRRAREIMWRNVDTG